MRAFFDHEHHGHSTRCVSVLASRSCGIASLGILYVGILRPSHPAYARWPETVEPLLGCPFSGHPVCSAVLNRKRSVPAIGYLWVWRGARTHLLSRPLGSVVRRLHAAGGRGDRICWGMERAMVLPGKPVRRRGILVRDHVGRHWSVHSSP